MKEVLLISGNNRNGNINYLLKQIEKQIGNSELVLLSNCNIEYCKGCLACHKVSNCVIKDDMQEIINKVINADFIIFGVPNYFDNVSGLFKNFIDRLHPLYKGELIKNKRVIFIYTAGGNEIGTQEEMHKAVEGTVKYLKLDLIKEYSYQALNTHDVEKQQEKIEKMIEEIKEIL